MVFDAVSKQTDKMLSTKPFRDAMGRDAQMLSREETKELITFKDRLPTLTQASDILITEAIKRAKGVRPGYGCDASWYYPPGAGQEAQP